ncbi:MAG: hypothetical protein ACRDFR_01245 [Candidatus Limnocylindria bacterium]
MTAPRGWGSSGIGLVAFLVLAACTPGSSGPGPSLGPTTSAGPSGGSPDPAAVTLTYEVGPRPGPVQPFRGEMTQHVHMAHGLVSMYFELRNVGEDPVTFLNTLYDYEPQQLYEPVVRLEWAEGGNAVYTRAGRFFPSPAILPAGATGAYVMGGQPVSGSGTPADLVAHIKYCPTRGMDDVPGIPLGVTDLSWVVNQDGEVTVHGTLVEEQQARRNHPPMVGVAFFAADETFIGAVVSAALGEPLASGERRAFMLSGGGVSTDRIDHATAWAVIP